jgi:hypothetical protein
MRIWIGLAAALALAWTLVPAAPASAQDWCGFQQKAGSRVRCGFSSVQECKQLLTEKTGKEKKKSDRAITCLPDPSFG